MASFVRKVPAASGTRAVQVVHKQGRRVVGIEHIGSAHDDAHLGFDAVADESFKSLVLAWIVELTSKADTIRVLDEIGVPACRCRTIFRSLARRVERD